MDPISQQAFVAAGAGGSDPLYVDDVFSTFLYEGDNTTGRNIVNGIDLSGEGGLVWVKRRATNPEDHVLLDTERGPNNFLMSNRTNAATTSGGPITAFNSDGFEVDNNGYVNGDGSFYASWTFRKAPGFFDIVTWTGDGTASRTIAHSLGSAPGMIFVKRLNDSDDWQVYHRSLGATKCLQLNQTYAETTASNRWYDTEPTSTVFTVANTSTNANGKTYVAYIFAHDDQSFGTNGNESIIKCGSFVIGSGAVSDVDLGFEPQFVLTKLTTTTGSWLVSDVMRGAAHTQYNYLLANSSNAESNLTGGNFYPTSTGFHYDSLGAAGNTVVYMAIRRPHKPPTAGTDVFKSVLQTSHPQVVSVGFPTDLAFTKDITYTGHNWWIPRLTEAYLRSDLTNAESATPTFEFDLQNSFSSGSWWGTSAYPVINYYFKRAPGFFDVVTADYPGSGAAIPHNLGVAPELIISKSRNGVVAWMVGSDYLQNTNGWNRYFELNSSGSEGGTSVVWDQTAPTATHFTLGTYPGSSYTGVFFLFATLSDISKVGSYTGTGYDINVDCGFTAGARFILIKRTDSSGDWYAWDSTRGIVSGNDSYFRFNLSNPPVTNTDYIDPLNAGFTVTSSAPAALNASGGTYLFLAIA